MFSAPANLALEKFDDDDDDKEVLHVPNKGIEPHKPLPAMGMLMAM